MRRLQPPSPAHRHIPLYTPCIPPVYPLYSNTGGIEGVYKGYTGGLEGDTAGIGGQQWKLTAGVPHSQPAGWGRKLTLDPSISHSVQNANQPARGHPARFHGPNGKSGQDPRAPAAQGRKVRVKELRKATGWDCALLAIDYALVRLELRSM